MKLIIMSGANSELAKPYLSYFKKQTQTTIIGIFNNRPIMKDTNLLPLRCNLMNKNETILQLTSVLNAFDNNIHHIILMHLIGSFKYEGLSRNPSIDIDGDGIDDTVYDSNINTFNNLYDVLSKNKITENTKLTLFNIGSKRDYAPNLVPRKSYALAKNILRKKFQILSNNNKNINTLFINAGTINLEKERELRPNGEYDYWLTIDEVFNASIQFLEDINAVGYKEIELYKYHPRYANQFNNETLLETHKRWLYEMGISHKQN